MKKTILMLALLLAAFSSYSQAPITIVNNSPCDIWYLIYGDNTNCGFTYRSQVFQLNAGNFVMYNDPTMVPGGLVDPSTSNVLGVSGVFYYARFLRADPNGSCSIGGSVSVDDCGNPTDVIDPADMTTCTSCANVSINWANGLGGITVTLN